MRLDPAQDRLGRLLWSSGYGLGSCVLHTHHVHT